VSSITACSPAVSPRRRRRTSGPATLAPDDELQLDRVIHEPARLAILTVLSSVKDVLTFLQRTTGLTKGNLELACLGYSRFTVEAELQLMAHVSGWLEEPRGWRWDS
jgi:hypothetical protein